MSIRDPEARKRWLQLWDDNPQIEDLTRRLRLFNMPEPRMQTPKPQTGVNRSDGPMAFLADQIVKRMEKAGWPSKIHCLHRSAHEQNVLYEKRVNGRRVTKAEAWMSAHQFYDAADIVHASLYWNAPPEYWKMLAVVVRQVANEYKVDITHGHYWKMVDSAHIELTDWRNHRMQNSKNGGYHEPTKEELYQRFLDVLPSQAGS